ncbi:acyltransferase family protein [Novosphingobium sediminicola]|uniref:Putative membrane protein YcfT n=1 Tax=Novosphingobium sediminicola TaxID=563162 RepID=A0A7W6CSS7_9SPHN|nr:acyltransferase [Novosphingobium sediminicola]MBB3957157.1 putative membrane protein YcfT [Novosphingobium sediminicola]
MANQKSLRLDWIDVAKGACIGLVVLGHSVEWYMRHLTGGAPIYLATFTQWLHPLRMPLFFAVSGLLAAGKIKQPIGNLWSKTAGLYILYLLWTALYCVKLIMPSARGPFPYPDLDQLILALVLPVYLWYIWALPVFYLIAWGLERLLGARSIYALVPMALLSVAAPAIGQACGPITGPPFDPVHVQTVSFNLFWFYLGLKGKDVWIVMVAKGSWIMLWLAGLLYGLVVAVSEYFDLEDYLAVISSALALRFAIEVLGRVDIQTHAGKCLAFVGRNTLPVYVMHTTVLTGFTLATRLLPAHAEQQYMMLSIQLLVPILIATLATLLCIGIAKAAAKTPFRFLFEPLPSPLVRDKNQLKLKRPPAASAR